MGWEASNRCALVWDCSDQELFAVLRIQIRNRIRKDPKLLAGSGSDPDPKPDQKQICKKEPYNQTKNR